MVGSSHASGMRRCLCLLLLLFIAAGCAAPRDEDGTPRYDSNGPFGPLLPRPLGRNTWEREPAATAAGWVGMVAGGAFGGVALFAVTFVHNPGGAVEAALPVFAIGAIGGAVAGGIVLTLPVRGIEALWDLFFGESDEPGHGPPEPPPRPRGEDDSRPPPSPPESLRAPPAALSRGGTPGAM